ncbi:hypothetical protein [Archaeoglobus veneficus]|uniref:Uncharacterized protein n=1 Tax=Archaeoglobus veneficus (strain DSM 11195 / SNP6) TaxID=693661 RepID=F2KRL3_ARCVS|nr:hypothetical protein [Archaeoglobus veneficus]AEA46778.1 hypothetical protein Arcve_0761 [Archaeoglobus veneficus SNP6]
MVGVSTVVHALQAVLSPIGIWASVEIGYIMGIGVFVLIGLLELVEVIAQVVKFKTAQGYE